ncbi:MAG TPA: M20 family metallopeptidase [Longimicrobiales bacterium]|nr:M20 family metallopeptidase [Longimicrobiales bacterium]
MSAFAELEAAAVEAAALAHLGRLVELESPSGEEARLRAVAAWLAGRLAALGADVETMDVAGVGEHVIARIAGADATLEPIVVLGHLDTVHPVGTFDPVFTIEEDRARGPGVFDMKGGWACVLEALVRLRVAGAAPRRPTVLLATCDEETGSGSSRALIEQTARGARAVLVPEPPLPDGGAKTRRKGVGGYRLEVTGRAAHAGVDPERGVNAIVELAHHILAATALADGERGTTISVGATGGGTASNVVPASAWAVVDVRFASAAEGDRVDAAIRSLRPRLQDAALRVTGGVNRPPVERTEANAALYGAARALAAEAGWELGEGSTGGGSDGSFTAGMGVPTLDGIGPRGGGAHAVDEHIVVGDLPRRVTLYGRLLETL